VNKELRHFVFAFLIAAALYFAAFHLIEHRRNSRGPWSVRFVATEAQAPRLVISQPSLRVTNVEVRFPSSRANALDETVRFDKARPVPFPVPFGECVFLDGTFLPGTVTLRCFGHEIELLPRALILDHEEWSWTNRIVDADGKKGGWKMSKPPGSLHLALGNVR
jgi:hypothetical protein